MSEKSADIDVRTPPANGSPAEVKAAETVTQKVIYGAPGSETAAQLEQAESLFPKGAAGAAPAAAAARPDELNEDTLRDIETQIKKWKQQAVTLRSIHAALTVIATFCSFLVAAFSGNAEFQKFLLPVFSFAAAVSIGLLSAFDLGSKANRLRRAWRLIRVQIFRYKQGKVTAETLIATYAMAEELIGDVREEPN